MREFFRKSRKQFALLRFSQVCGKLFYRPVFKKQRAADIRDEIPQLIRQLNDQNRVNAVFIQRSQRVYLFCLSSFNTFAAALIRKAAVFSESPSPACLMGS